MNAAIIFAAALTVTPGSPDEVPVPDFDHGCYLGDWEGAVTRLVYEGPPSAPFFVGLIGEDLEPSGVVAVEADPRGRGDVTVQFARSFVTTEVWEAFADDEGLVAVTVSPGTGFTVGDCEEGACDVRVGGRALWALEDSWEGRLLPPPPPSDEIGWWVPAIREGDAGWVRGTGFIIEIQCVGPDEGADLTLAKWHRGE